MGVKFLELSFLGGKCSGGNYRRNKNYRVIFSGAKIANTTYIIIISTYQQY